VFTRDVNTAVDYFFTHHASAAQPPAPKVSEAKIQQLYEAYKSVETSTMDDDSIEKFYQDLGVNSETDEVVLLISSYMQAENIGEYTWPEFQKGCLALGVDSISGFKNKLSSLYNELQDTEKYRAMYKFTFSFASARNYKNVDKAIALALWELFFGKKCKFLALWSTFLEEEKKGL